MADYPPAEFLRRLQATGFRDLSGTRASATIPINERLINEWVATRVPPTGPLSAVVVHPLEGDRFAVRLTPRAAFLPGVTLTLEIEAQPDLPSSPVLRLRMATMGGLLGFAAGALPIGGMLPPGVSLQRDHILVDLQAVVRHHGGADVLQHVTRLRVNTEVGRVVLHVGIAIT